jgi:AraC-like DNA-binding protein
VEQEVNGRRYSFEPGTLIFMRPGDTHRLWGEAMMLYNILYSEELLATSASVRALADQEDVPYVMLPEADRPEFARRVEEMLVRQHTPEGELMLTHFFYEAMVRWFCPASVAERRTMPAWLSDALHELEQVDVAEWSVGLIFKKCHKTREHVARTFQAILGRSPSQYINWRRLEKVRTMLAYSSRSVNALCYEAGFNNINYFNRLFRRYFGTTPGRYRREHGVERGVLRGIGVSDDSDAGT